ncbi:MAG: sugar ABC transporter permease [Bacilli bacterium]|nr:sugar ABC transporter permease [Bacilli bacterium]
MTENKELKESIFRRIFYSKLFFILFMLAPMLLHLLIFWAGVQVEFISLAFIDADTGTFSFINFKNLFENLLTGAGDLSVLPESLKNTFLFFMIGVLQIPLYLFFAYMLYKQMFGYKFVRLAMYLPHMISTLMMAIMFQQLLMTDGPVITFLNGTLGLNIPTPIIMNFPLVEIAFFDIWIGMGANLVLWMGAMGRIPRELLECGELEGVTPVQEFIKIIFPLIYPTFTTFITLSFVNILSASGSILIFTEGNYGTNTLSFWLWNVAYKGRTDQYGISSALGLVMCIVTIPLVYLGRKFINRFGGEVEY